MDTSVFFISNPLIDQVTRDEGGTPQFSSFLIRIFIRSPEMKEDYVHVQVFEPSMRAFALLGLRHFGVSHVVQQLSISMFLSILTFDFDLILGLFFTFGGPNGLFSLGRDRV